MSLQEGESYKYLGILEVDKFLEEKMKLIVSKEYIRRLRKVLKSKLNAAEYSVQKTVLLGTGRILRKVLEI